MENTTKSTLISGYMNDSGLLDEGNFLKVIRVLTQTHLMVGFVCRDYHMINFFTTSEKFAETIT